MAKRDELTKIQLSETDIPKQWYNIVADMPEKPDPYYSPATLKPIEPAEMAAIFPRAILEMEMSAERYIDIPQPVRELYKQFRPSPLYRARGLEKALGTPARIYYKYEGGNATGSHKLNTALAQAYFNKAEGIRHLTTETGAGQWGCAISMAANHFGLDCTVYMVRVSLEQKPYRKILMQTFGASVLASPSDTTAVGRAMRKENPDCSGSLGMAISEAIEVAAGRPDTNYSLGSVLNHVLLHQTVIGQEAKKQLEIVDEYPDVVVACCGGGSNFGGMTFPFLQDKFTKGAAVRCVAVEPASCPTLTRGVYANDYNDTGKMTPISKMYTLGHDFMPSGIHAGGLRFHGDSALVSKLYHHGHIEAQSYPQTEVFESAVLFTRAEGIVPAPESAHAIRGAVTEAMRCKREGKAETIVFCLSGNGYFDMAAYENYLSGSICDAPFDENTLRESLKKLPKID